VLGGGAYTSRGLEERIFSSTAVRRQIQGRREEQEHRRTCQGVMSQEKSGGARDSGGLEKAGSSLTALGWHSLVATNKKSKR